RAGARRWPASPEQRRGRWLRVHRRLRGARPQPFAPGRHLAGDDCAVRAPVSCTRLCAVVLVWAACEGAVRAAEPAPDASADDDAAAGAPGDASALDGGGPGAADAGAPSASDAGVAPPPAPPVAKVSFYGRVLEKGTGKPLGAAAIAIDGAAVAETDAE